jgi:YD repeat-containing protein
MLPLVYDADNRLTTMVDGVGTTHYSYDAIGQLLSAGGVVARGHGELHVSRSVAADDERAGAQRGGLDAELRV